MSIVGKKIGFSEFASPGKVPWRDLDVDIVIEAPDKFHTTELLQPDFDGGVKKVIVAAAVKEGALNLVMRINDHLSQPDQHR